MPSHELQRRWGRALPAAVAVAAAVYANTLLSTGFVWDDKYVVAANPLLRSWGSLPKLLTTGYWEGVFGMSGHDAHYRPVLLLSYFLTYQAAGLASWAYHLGNILLHALNCFLLLRLLRRSYPEATAAAAACFFAVLPIHSESVAYVSGRPELLVTTWLLAAWSDLLPPSSDESPSFLLWARGLGFYVLALLTQEQAVMFAPILILHLWAFHSSDFRGRACLRSCIGTAAAAAFYVLARFMILARPFHTSVHYFAGKSYLTVLLTMSRFVCARYLLPMAGGLGLRIDFSRPLVSDSGPGDAAAWLCFGAGVLLLAEAARRLASGLRGARTGFWLWSAFLFLLPVSNLILPFNVLGAQRYLYFPTLGFCVLAARILDGLESSAARKTALAALSVWYGGLAVSANARWLNEGNFYGAWARENPYSAEARSGLGVLLAQEGRAAEAARSFEEAAALNPKNPEPYYNLGRLYYEHGDWKKAEGYFMQATERSPSDADTWTFLAAVSERRGRLPEAEDLYGRALRFRPWDPNAHFNLARVLMGAGRNGEAAAHLREYLRLEPSAPDAAQVRALLAVVEKRGPAANPGVPRAL